MKKDYSAPIVLVLEADADMVVCTSPGGNVSPGGIEDLDYGVI